MKTISLFAVAALTFATVAHAQKPIPGPGPMSEGEVLKVLPKAVLLKHGPIRNIGMDAMTMQFSVPDEKILKSIRKGDKVRFAAAFVDGQFVVTRIEAVAKKPS